jgi:hypothetical protein
VVSVTVVVSVVGVPAVVVVVSFTTVGNVRWMLSEVTNDPSAVERVFL